MKYKFSVYIGRCSNGYDEIVCTKEFARLSLVCGYMDFICFNNIHIFQYDIFWFFAVHGT